ncbi:MAG TPA: hypothetical protein VGD66_12830 [Allosphingosinicella sp.]|jgi:hypothetical protein
MKALSLLAAAAAALVASAAASHPPYGLVVDRGGNIYFSDLEAVWRVAPDGRASLFRPGEEGVHVHELALAPDGSIEGDLNRYDPATEIFSSAIWRRPAQGRENWVLAPTPAPPKGIGLWQDRAGNRYTAQWVSNKDRRTMLFRRSPDGRVTLLYGPRDKAARFREAIVSSIGGMTFPADGSLIFADGRALRRVAPGGASTRVYEGPAGASLRGLAAAPDGRILAADWGRRIVLAVSAQGKAETLYASPTGWLPTAAALAGPRLLVLEANADPYDNAHRMRLVEVKDRRGTVIAGPKGAVAAAPSATARAAEPERRAGTGTIAAMAAIAVAAAALAGVAVRRLRDSRKAVG